MEIIWCKEQSAMQATFITRMDNNVLARLNTRSALSAYSVFLSIKAFFRKYAIMRTFLPRPIHEIMTQNNFTQVVQVAQLA